MNYFSHGAYIEKLKIIVDTYQPNMGDQGFSDWCTSVRALADIPGGTYAYARECLKNILDNIVPSGSDDTPTTISSNSLTYNFSITFLDQIKDNSSLSSLANIAPIPTLAEAPTYGHIVATSPDPSPTTKSNAKDVNCTTDNADTAPSITLTGKSAETALQIRYVHFLITKISKDYLDLLSAVHSNDLPQIQSDLLSINRRHAELEANLDRCSN